MRKALQERLEIAKTLKADILKNFDNKQVLDANGEVTKSLKEIEVELKEQITLLEARAKLFEEGVLDGNFNKSKERVDLLTNALEGLLKKQIELQRQKESNPDFIGQESIDKTIGQIEQVKRALKAANFVNDIRELLQTIPDAISEALNEGVRAVFAGTLKISELFRNMAQNILLSLSKIFANRALKGIGDQLNKLAETIAKSDIGRKIAGALGINVDDAFDIGKHGTPEQQLKSALDANTNLQKTQLIPTLRELIAALRGVITGQPVPGKDPFPVGGKILPDIDTPLPPGQLPIGTPEEILSNSASSEIFDQFSEDFVSGFENAFNNASTLVTEDITNFGSQFVQNFNEPFNDFISSFGESFTSGFDQVGSLLTSETSTVTQSLSSGLSGLFNTASSGFGSFFSGLGSLLQNGLSSLTSGLGSVFSGIGSGIGSLFSFFGFAEGGIIPGTPSKKDDKLVPMRSGEGVLTPEATSYYGGKDFIDAVNNMALPDFFSGLQAASAPAQFAGVASQATGSAPKAQSGGSTRTNERPIYVTVVNKGPVVDPSHFKMKPSEVTEIVVNGIRKDKALRRVINENTQLSKGGF
jgi:hypothetical protein